MAMAAAVAVVVAVVAVAVAVGVVVVGGGGGAGAGAGVGARASASADAGDDRDESVKKAKRRMMMTMVRIHVDEGEDHHQQPCSQYDGCENDCDNGGGREEAHDGGTANGSRGDNYSSGKGMQHACKGSRRNRSQITSGNLSDAKSEQKSKPQKPVKP